MSFTTEEWANKVQSYQRKHFGKRFEGASLSRTEIFSKERQQSIRRFCEDHNSRENKFVFLILMGPPGTGKTYLAAALMEWVHQKFNTFRIWKEQALYEKLRVAIDQSHDFTHTLRFASDDEIIVLDDLGANFVNQWRKDVIFNFVDMRYENCLKTIITTNLTQEEIEKKYEERTRSRLFGHESVVVDFFDAPDLREHGL